MRVKRLRGPGRLVFEYLDGRSRHAVLHEDQQRVADGWPPHWALPAVMTGPGCWQLRIRGDGVDERLPFDVSPVDWRRHWRHTTGGRR